MFIGDDWEHRLNRDLGRGNGEPEPRHGRCDCGFTGTAAEILHHHVQTKHTYTYRGKDQVCTLRDCVCAMRDDR